MKKIILMAAAITTMIAGPAPAAPPAWTWTGFYLGGNAGYGWGRDQGPIILGGGFAPDFNTALNGFIGGGQFGYNWQVSDWVYGLEADFQGSAQRGNANAFCRGGTTTSANGLCTQGHVGDTINDPALPVTTSLNEKLEWLGTIRARIGSTITPTLLPYVTGGLAYGQIRVTETVSGVNVIGVNGANGATFTPAGGSFSNSTVKFGWTIGAGVESVLWGNWIGRMEYLYVDLGNVSGSFATSLIAPGGSKLVAGYNSHFTDNIVRVGLSYAWY